MPPWLGWLASLNPLTFAIEPIRAAYAEVLSICRLFFWMRLTAT